jgi:membrane fusion protein, multidrug efflux system
MDDPKQPDMPAERKKPSQEKEQPDQKEETSEKKPDDKNVKPKGPPKPPFYKRPKLMLVLGISLVVLVVAGIGWWLYARQYQSTDDAFIDGHIIPISPNVSAIVAAVHIDDNFRVKQGDLLVELDPRDFQVVVDQTNANANSAREKLAQAQAEVEVSNANVDQARAEVIVAQAVADNANNQYERFLHLEKQARSQQQLDDATATLKSDQAQVEAAKAKLSATQASASSAVVSVKLAATDVDRATADLKQAQIDLDYCKIFAPEDGLITRKNVEPGSYVEKGQPLFSIVPTAVWVTANFKETQLGRMEPGQPVTIEVDAYSDRKFQGKVESIQNGSGSRFSLLPPENATGNYVKVVQRIPVKIIFDPGETDIKDYLLAPGMSVEPQVKVR